MKKLTFLFTMIFMTTLASVAQTRELTGLVVDEQGEPLIGATVRVQGTNQMTVTDIDGKFTMSVKKDGVIEVSYIGFEKKIVNSGNLTNLKIVLNPSVNTLDEVVVIGYGQVRKADLTGAVSSVSQKQMNINRNTSVAEALQGTMSGVNVRRSSGAPGDDAEIQVRGVTTINDSSPLFIIDGIPDDINSVNPTDIESISVLKDAASASIYGARAASGVVLITTKKAEEGKMKVNYEGSVGFDTDTAHPEVVDVLTYMRLRNEEAWNQNANPEGLDNIYNIWSKDYIAEYMANNAENPDRYPSTD